MACDQPKALKRQFHTKLQGYVNSSCVHTLNFDKEVHLVNLQHESKEITMYMYYTLREFNSAKNTKENSLSMVVTM